MRRILTLGLLTSIVGLCALTAPGQTIKTDPKDGKTEPKDVKPDPNVEIKWPKQIAGKSLDNWVGEMRNSKDASSREAAVRTVPLFGPDSRKAASVNLLHVMQKDPDVSVRLAAIQVVPILGFDKPELEEGLNYMVRIVDQQIPYDRSFRTETVLALGNCGPIAKRAIPAIASARCLGDVGSWQMRKASAFALGRLGLPVGPKDGPDGQAIVALSNRLLLNNESSHVVRKEIINSMILLGPAHVESTWKKQRDALTAAMKDGDPAIAIWARVAFIRTETELIKANDTNLARIAGYLSSTDLAAKVEAIQALGTLANEAKSKLPDLAALATTKSKKNEDLALAASAIWAMGQMTDETAKILPLIDPLKRHDNEAIKRAAIDAYRNLTEKKDPKAPDEPKKDIVPKKGLGM